jgi:hypothetical protein
LRFGNNGKQHGVISQNLARVSVHDHFAPHLFVLRNDPNAAE